MKHIIVVTFALLITFFILSAETLPGEPITIGHQGRSLDNLGQPAVDGIHSVTYRIYDDSTAGTLLWTETKEITTSNGLFNSVLGSTSSLDLSVFNAGNKFLEVQIGGAPPNPIGSGEANCDGTVNVSDAVWIINYVFVGSNAPCNTNGDNIPDC